MKEKYNQKLVCAVLCLYHAFWDRRVIAKTLKIPPVRVDNIIYLHR